MNKTLQKLHLNCNKISDDGAAAISDGLKINKSLQELGLQGLQGLQGLREMFLDMLLLLIKEQKVLLNSLK